jgi:uncharacterized protein
MNGASRMARRYHWLSEGLESFVDAPHAAIEGRPGGAIVNLTDHRAEAGRRAQLALVAGGPDAVIAQVRRLHARGPLPHLALPARHAVQPSDVVLRRLHGALAAAAERGPRDFTDLLLTPGLGARTVLSLALAAEVIHGAPCRFSDPARFSLAHGGKDGHPFPVPLKVYDETLRVLRGAVDRAKLGNDDRLEAVRRLDVEARRLERAAEGTSVDAFLAREREDSWKYGGRTLFGEARTGVDPMRPMAPHTPTLSPRYRSFEPPEDAGGEGERTAPIATGTVTSNPNTTATSKPTGTRNRGRAPTQLALPLGPRR